MLRFFLAVALSFGGLWGQCAIERPLSDVIPELEGWKVAGSLVRRLHNPGALVYAGQPGAWRGAQGYAQFAKDEDGWAALDRDLAAKRRRGLSTDRIVAVWSADPLRYRRAVCR